MPKLRVTKIKGFTVTNAVSIHMSSKELATVVNDYCKANTSTLSTDVYLAFIRTFACMYSEMHFFIRVVCETF